MGAVLKYGDCSSNMAVNRQHMTRITSDWKLEERNLIPSHLHFLVQFMFFDLKILCCFKVQSEQMMI